jgi:signal transduction histidine kinase
MISWARRRMAAWHRAGSVIRARAMTAACGRRLNLEPLDLWFLGLRVAVLAAGIAWWSRSPDWTGAPQLPILAAFAAFSVGLYATNALRPGRLPTLYRVAALFDLGVVFFLVRITGGFASELHLAFILLVALHAFYFGLATGVATAAGAALLYALAVDWPPPMPGFALRAAFFGLVGLCMGVLAEQSRRRRHALERQQERMLHSDRLATVGELAAGLAHELRNPLAGISGALHVLGGQFGAGDDRRLLLDDVQAQIDRMNRALSDLLQHARPVTPQRIAVEVHGLLEHSLQFLPRLGVEIVRRYDESLPPLSLDPNLVHQAFLNILVNARQAMPQGGRISLETRPGPDGDGAIEIRISDTGSGIAQENLARIFQPFFTTKAQGTGLGLAIAARVVEQHGGRITVASVPGAGSTFTIFLPRMPVSEPARSDRHELQSTGR